MGSGKVFALGLDGVSFTLLERYMERGLLPNLREMISSGLELKQMDAPLPEVSSTSWTSFMTGVNPGEHGIYGFMELRPGSYGLYFPNYRDVKAPAVWDIIGGTSGERRSSLSDRYGIDLGRPFRTIAVNIPQTYPAPAINGVLTAGFVCPDLRKGTYPERAYDYLKSIDYLPDIDPEKALSDPGGFFREALCAVDKRAEACLHFLENEEWDLFICVFTETDRINHFFYDAAFDETNVHHGRFVSFYEKLDAVTGILWRRFMELTEGDGLFLTLSDHGFTEIRKEVYLNAWLEENGFLRLREEGEYFERIGPGTRAFALDPARVYLNRTGQRPRGEVRSWQEEELINELREGLLSMHSPDGERVIKEVREKERLYSGPEIRRAPDLVCTGHDGFDLKGSLMSAAVFGRGSLKGMHTAHDAHCMVPAGFLEGAKKPHIEALAPAILARLMPGAKRSTEEPLLEKCNAFGK